MNQAVSSMLLFLRDERELWQHANDALISQQLPPFSREEWLQKCEKHQIAAAVSVAP